jgi:thiamine pyrophosphate-dependent acetolactate synthase large subunit-like protein
MPSNTEQLLQTGTLTIVNSHASSSSSANSYAAEQVATLPYEEIIRAAGGDGERIESPGELLEAIQRGLTRAAAGQMALLNVITQPG